MQLIDNRKGNRHQILSIPYCLLVLGLDERVAPRTSVWWFDRLLPDSTGNNQEPRAIQEALAPQRHQRSRIKQNPRNLGSNQGNLD